MCSCASARSALCSCAWSYKQPFVHLCGVVHAALFLQCLLAALCMHTCADGRSCNALQAWRWVQRRWGGCMQVCVCKVRKCMLELSQAAHPCDTRSPEVPVFAKSRLASGRQAAVAPCGLGRGRPWTAMRAGMGKCMDWRQSSGARWWCSFLGSWRRSCRRLQDCASLLGHPASMPVCSCMHCVHAGARSCMHTERLSENLVKQKQDLF